MTTRMTEWFRGFVRNNKGAVMPILAMSFIPILLSIGAGVDFARAYMVKAKLQEAVDSAALAGRRAMSKEDLSTAQQDVEAFLAFNFPTGIYNTTQVVTRLTKPDVGTVRVEASTTVPTSLLALAGMTSFPITVVSEAKQNFDNIDIILVLDTTGSMKDSLGGQVKLEALKDAVRELYAQLKDAQAELQKQGLRLRIGIVPYSGTVNVGNLLKAKDPSYIQTSSVPYWHWRASRTFFFTSWSYSRANYNLSNYVNGGQLGNINNNNNDSTARWAGCIEERATDPTIIADDPRGGPTSLALDLDIDLIPNTSNTTKWKPYIFDPLNGSPNEYCPSPSVELTQMDESELEGHLSKLIAQGSTYHDIGMIWGTRMISSGGVFGPDNPSEYAQRTVQKHIIFMTDGLISTPIDICGRVVWGVCDRSTADHAHAYSAWGVELFDKRIGALTNDDNNARHTTRFLMACNEAKARKISVWTIAFGTGPVDSLTKCASNSDQATVADNSTQLIERFAEIGRNIGPLRLSK